MKRNNKKGFTIIELVVVIAVIAILAAVLIPTFSSIIKKANTSVDIQAVQQMNTLLATHVDGSIKNVSDAIKALDEEDIDLDNYKALQKNHYFYFVMNGKTPMIIYTDAEDNVLYPEVTLANDVQWMSLSGEIPTDASWVDNAKTEDGVRSATIASGEQLADLMSKYRNNDDAATSVTKIELTGDIDLKGSSETFGDVTKALTIDGSKGENGTTDYYTISGLRADTNSVVHTYQEVNKKNQCYGLINAAKGGSNITIKNVNISDVVITDSTGNTDFGRSAILIGNVYGSSKITIENVNIDNCAVYGGDKVAVLIGGTENNSGGSNITINNVKVTNTTVLGGCYVAKAVACIWSDLSLTFEGCDFSGVTVGVDEAVFKTADFFGTEIDFVTGELITSAEKYTDEIKQRFSYDSGNNTYARCTVTIKGTAYNYYCGITTEDYYWKDSKIKTDNDKSYQCNKSGSQNITKSSS